MGLFNKKRKINPAANCCACGYVIYLEEGVELAIQNNFSQGYALPIVVCPHCGIAFTVSVQRHAPDVVRMYLINVVNTDGSIDRS